MLKNFANETVVFFGSDAVSFVNILSILKFFEAIVCLETNLPERGLVGVNVDTQILTDSVTSVDFQILQWPPTYLDIPLGGNPRTLSFWDPGVCKIPKQLACWKGAFFFSLLVGWLVGSLLCSLVWLVLLYTFSLVRIPVVVAQKIELCGFPLVGYGLGDGSCIKFWEEIWIGTVPHSEAFPRLFMLFSLQNTCVCQF